MKEIESLQIINFQSHENTVIDFCKGLNVFVGDSRNGKTSILRALRWLYFNEPRGDRFIRSGEDQCEVSVTLTDGIRIQRIRNINGKINCYVLNEPGKDEEEFTKFNKEVPLEIQQALGVSKLYLDKDSSIELNFSRQMDAAFLVSDSAPRRTKIIGRVVNLHVIDSANRTAESDLKAAKRKKTELEEDLKSLQEKINTFNDLPGKETALEKAHELMAQANALKLKAEKLQEIEDAIQRVQLAIADNNKNLERLQDIEVAENLIQKMISKEKILSCLEETHQKITVSIQCLDIQTNLLNKLDKLDVAVSSFDEIVKRAGRLSNLQNVNQQITSTQGSLQSQLEILARLQLLDDASTHCSVIKRKNNSLIIFSDLNERISENREKLQSFSVLLSKTEKIEHGQEIIASLYRLREKGYKLTEISNQIKATQLQLRHCLTTTSGLANIDKTCDLLNQLQNNALRLNALENLDTRCTKLGGQYEECILNLTGLEEKYSQLLNEYTGTLKQSGRCPVCHTNMTPEVITQLASGY